jgi:sensor c-di-GMP phosphodiesterase-like protein
MALATDHAPAPVAPLSPEAADRRHALTQGLPVIAQRIEAPAQLRKLRALGCEFGQGHLFSPALSAADMAALLARWSPAEIVELFSAA